MDIRRSSIVLVAALGLTTACHTRPPAVAAMAAPTPAPPRATRPVSPPPAPRAAVTPRTTAPAALSEEELFRRESLDQVNGAHPLADAFFDFQRSVIRDDARAAIDQDAAWLRKWPSTSIRIEGHCDDMGTAEYNLSLGNERADALRNYLIALGVDATRIAVVSLGKEAPFCSTSDDDACRSQNRRGHFIVTAK